MSSAPIKKRKLYDRLEEVSGYRIMDMKKFSAALLEIHVCKDGYLQIMEDTDAQKGLCCKFYLVCSKCLTGVPFRSSSLVAHDRSYDVNHRMTTAAAKIGIGRQSLTDLCYMMNMPGAPPVTESNCSTQP
ncbi:hypothetical protein HOLleu_40815 [Holothuria leucospilota]|uniref:Mutator-like transposase domain-containing protein n=1 Tax=Holothuria leucospilota TaxID=206669 RepID=A0A9Q0YDW0_HOLLE|nr:hypothetical protein HOLleu_40815 [Holothuria leucospilota]